MTDQAILVTGAAGNIGSQVCRFLTGGERRVYAATRSPGRGADHFSGTIPRHFDLTDEATWAPALDGVSRVFLVRPPHIAHIKRDMYPFMRAMKQAAIEHVVFLSVQGAERNPVVPHHTVERALLDLELPYTFLRPSFFMQNLTTTHLPEIRDERRIFVPAGDGETNFIDARDIGEAAAMVLGDDRYRNRAYTLTGTRNYTYHEVAARLSSILGRPIRYEPARIFPFLAYQRSQGRTLGHALVMYALYSVTRMGRAGGPTEDFRAITGREPRSLDEFIDDHRGLFAPVA